MTCAKCMVVKFCSEACARKANKLWHERECSFRCWKPQLLHLPPQSFEEVMSLPPVNQCHMLVTSNRYIAIPRLTVRELASALLNASDTEVHAALAHLSARGLLPWQTVPASPWTQFVASCLGFDCRRKPLQPLYVLHEDFPRLMSPTLLAASVFYGYAPWKAFAFQSPITYIAAYGGTWDGVSKRVWSESKAFLTDSCPCSLNTSLFLDLIDWTSAALENPEQRETARCRSAVVMREVVKYVRANVNREAGPYERAWRKQPSDFNVTERELGVCQRAWTQFRDFHVSGMRMAWVECCVRAAICLNSCRTGP